MPARDAFIVVHACFSAAHVRQMQRTLKQSIHIHRLLRAVHATAEHAKLLCMLRVTCTKREALAFRSDRGADIFTLQDARDVARNREVEHKNGHIVVHAQRSGGGVHDMQALREHIDVADGLEALWYRW